MNSAEEKLYNYIKENGPMARNMIGAFVVKEDCVGVLDTLMLKGYVVEKDGLYTVTRKG